VSDRVLEALGSIVGESARALRDAGASTFEASGSQAPAPAFARTSAPLESTRSDLASAGATEPDEPTWDEVDRLFRGGAS